MGRVDSAESTRRRQGVDEEFIATGRSWSPAVAERSPAVVTVRGDAVPAHVGAHDSIRTGGRTISAGI